MGTKLRCGVIGAGNMGYYHIKTLLEMKGEVVLTAICDKDEEVGKGIRKKYLARYYEDYLEMIENEKLDMVTICVPTELHYKVGKACVLKGLNVLMEKPICHTVEKAEKLLDLAKEKQVTFMVGHTERFNPAVLKAKELIEKGQIGEIISMRGIRIGGLPKKIKGNNISMDLAIHEIDIANYLLNDIPLEVSSKKKRVELKEKDDYVEFLLKYKNANAKIEASWASPNKVRTLEIIGTKGIINLDYINQKVEGPSIKKEISIVKKHPLSEELKHFLRSVREKHRPESSYALEALKIALHDQERELAYENI